MSSLRLFLAGDVMLGRGIDQIQRASCPPRIHEEWVRSARSYVTLAERANGPIPRNVGPDYVWGDALDLLRRRAPDARIVNLETALTLSEAWAPKGIHYRAHPANVDILRAAAIDCVSLANNHVLDWGQDGLAETFGTLARAGVASTGAGPDADLARAPAILALGPGRRLVVLGLAMRDAGVPDTWSAGIGRPGVWLLEDPGPRALRELRTRLERTRRPGDRTMVSIHWGSNWGYEIPAGHRRLARRLIDEVGVDLIHGHSSHHPRGMEVYQGHLILYGCGDFLNDYEGIGGHGEFRGEMVVAYFPTLDAQDGRLLDLEMVPFRIRRFRLERPSDRDLRHVHETLDREARRLGGVGIDREQGTLRLSGVGAARG